MREGNRDQEEVAKPLDTSASCNRGRSHVAEATSFQTWCRMAVIPALWGLRQEDPLSLRPAWFPERDLVSKKGGGFKAAA